MTQLKTLADSSKLTIQRTDTPAVPVVKPTIEHSTVEAVARKQGTNPAAEVKTRTCEDQISNCEHLRKLDVCKTSRSSMKKLCQKTCDLCD